MKRIKDNYSLFTYLFLGFVTFGVYSIWCLHHLVKDVNELCAEYGKRSSGVVIYLLLSIVTCGAYSVFWWFRIADMLAYAVKKRELRSNITSGFVLASMALNYIMCGIAGWVGIHKVFEATNELAGDYNRRKATEAALNAQREV